MASPEPIGVGIDVEDRNALDHLGDEAVARAAARWLHPDEQAWWKARESPREALIVALGCKEAVWKAGDGAGLSADVRLAISGPLERGNAAGTAGGRSFTVAWCRRGGSVVAVALAYADVPVIPTRC